MNDRTRRKLRKLRRDPKLFFKDMIRKRFRINPRWGLRMRPFRQSRGHYKYAVVSAVYNAAPYLDDYFRTLTRQTLKFSNNITLILVDDGSTDDSAKIIQRWQQRYPNNIIYLHKENGGQASARNMGLDYIEQSELAVDFVTFTDPDDFVSTDYFRSVDRFIARNKGLPLEMVVCNVIIYFEKWAMYQDSHPSRFRFAKGNVSMPVSEMTDHLPGAASVAFFGLKPLFRDKHRFDERIRPMFEDGHFVAIFTGLIEDAAIGFLKDARYYYRKRASVDSTLNLAPSQPSFFLDVNQYGCLDLVNFFVRQGRSPLPVWAQRTLLYQLCNYFTWSSLVNRPERANVLDTEEKQIFLLLLDEVLSYIDRDVIMEFELARFWFLHKVGVLHCFKQERPPFQIVYVEDYDPVKNLLLLQYFTGEQGPENYSIDGKDVTPVYTKTMRHDFLGRTFALERRVWLPLPVQEKSYSHLSVDLGDCYDHVRISLNAKQHKGPLALKAVFSHFPERPGASEQRPWLLMDRSNEADDSAEYLYRYIREQNPSQALRFAVLQDTPEWSRLLNESFNLVPFGTLAYRQALLDCGKFISSHSDRHFFTGIKRDEMRDKEIVFLQHGIIKDDISKWLNGKKIACFVTSAPAEFESIAGNNNRYKFSPKEVTLAGLPRHDVLLRRQTQMPPEKMVLVIPTWRNSLTPSRDDLGRVRKSPEFMESEYAQAWQSFLTSPRLEQILKQAGYRLVFCPHFNVRPYVDDFNLPAHIECIPELKGPLQEQFCKASVMITDFSSVAFEMALLRKALLYYQFDYDDVIAGSHIHQDGYFDYQRDGFGPVCLDEASLLDALEEQLKRNEKPAPEYLQRMDEFFAYRDGGNCERVYRAIKALDEPDIPADVQLRAHYEHAALAMRTQDWHMAAQRWKRLLAGFGDQLSRDMQTDAENQLAKALELRATDLRQKLAGIDAQLQSLQATDQQSSGMTDSSLKDSLTEEEEQNATGIHSRTH